MTQKTKENPWIMDVRVRERNLKSGSLTEKDLEKQLAALPDLADQAEPFGTSQPALAQPPAPPPAPVVHQPPVQHAALVESGLEDEEEDEEDEDEDDEDEDEDGGEAAPVNDAAVGPNDAGTGGGEGEP